MVSHLINPDLHCWIPNLIRDLFDPASVQAILNKSIPTTPTPDKLIWVPDSRGSFSVKSAYHSIHTLSSQPIPTNTNWKKLWSLKFPEKTKMFLWRLGVNVFPTRENLSKRIHVADPSCLFYRDNLETPYHLFIKCNASRALWFSACQGFRSEDVVISHPEDIVKIILNPPKFLGNNTDVKKVYLNMALILEEIWLSRNRMLHRNCSWDLAATIHSIHSRFHECSLSLYTPTTPKTPTTQHLWTPSPLGWIKINVDAIVSANLASIAVVSRNHSGTPIKIWARTIKKTTPLQAKTEALHWVVQLAKIEDWRYVIFKGNAKQFFDAINSPNIPYSWSIHTTISNIRNLASLFTYALLFGFLEPAMVLHTMQQGLLFYLGFLFSSIRIIFPLPCWLLVRMIIPLVFPVFK